MPADCGSDERRGEGMNAGDELLGPARAQGRGPSPALLWRDEVVSYDALAEAIDKAGNGLKSLGVGPDDRVVMLLTDSPELVACYLGAMKIGAVAVAVNLRLSADDLAYILADSEAKVLLIDRQFRPLYDLVSARFHDRLTVVEAHVDGAGPSQLGRFIAQQDAALAATDRAPDDMAFWIYTSGTTGFPKGAVHSHKDVPVAELYARETLGIGPGDVLFATSKLFFAYALGTCLFASLRLGATTVLSDVWPGPEAVAGIIDTHRPTVVFSVPTMYRNMLGDGVTDRDSFRAVRHFVSAGEKLPASLWHRWTDATRVEILDGMGTSETIYMLLTNSPGAVCPWQFRQGGARRRAQARGRRGRGGTIGPAGYPVGADCVSLHELLGQARDVGRGLSRRVVSQRRHVFGGRRRLLASSGAL